MRIPIIAGNWKMYKTIPQALELLRGIRYSIPHPQNVEVVVAPPFSALASVAEECRDSYIGVAAQNMHWEDEGAFTGEISGAFIRDAGGEYVIIGHSERRQYFGETDGTVNRKVAAAVRHDLIPIVCVGETLEEREKGITFEVVGRQIGDGLPPLDEGRAKKVVIAYEPVWAIGTGRNATPDQAEEVHLFLRKLLARMFEETTADAVRILYGGSVKPGNAGELFGQPDIDGALVGGASLTVEGFSEIVKLAMKV